MKGRPLTVTCPKSEAHWRSRSGLPGISSEDGDGKGLELVSPTIRARRVGEYRRQQARVRCPGCGHVWWSSHPSAVSAALEAGAS